MSTVGVTRLAYSRQACRPDYVRKILDGIAEAFRHSLNRPKRPCGLSAVCRVLSPALLRLIIVLAAAPARIAGLGERLGVGLEKGAEAVVAPEVLVRNQDIDRGLARHEAALGLIAQHRDELGSVVGLAAQRLRRGGPRGSPRRGPGAAIDAVLRGRGAGGGGAC